MANINDRVTAISHTEGNRAFIYGHGVYVGDEVPDDSAAGWMAKTMREIKRANPKIVLDSGKVVWGCECWWGSEATVKEKLDGCEIVVVDIDEARRKAAESEVEEAGAAQEP